MNAKPVLTLVTAALMIAALLLLLPTTVHGQVPPGFIINDADATTYVTTTASSQLNMLISSVPPRFVVQHANGIRYYNMPPISSTLLSLMAQVPDRFVIQYANADRFYGFTYPVGMISDTVPPQITGTVTCDMVSASSVMISWRTDEFADSAVLYGTQPVAYTSIVTDPLYFKLHTINLTGLTYGIAYHYAVRSTDRSGNTSQSSDYVCTIPAPPTDLQVMKSDSPDPVRLGSPLTYTVVVANIGPITATGVILTDTLPGSVLFGSVTSTQGSCNGSSIITCSLGALNATANAAATIVVTPTVGGTIVNTASVSSNESDSNPTNNTDTESTTVLPADLSVSNTDSPDPAYVGQATHLHAYRD